MFLNGKASHWRSVNRRRCENTKRSVELNLESNLLPSPEQARQYYQHHRMSAIAASFINSKRVFPIGRLDKVRVVSSTITAIWWYPRAGSDRKSIGDGFDKPITDKFS